MPVSGIVVRIVPEAQDEVVRQLEKIPQVNLQPALRPEVLVAVLETPDLESEKALSDRIAGLTGVKAVSLAYHNFEDVAEAGA